MQEQCCLTRTHVCDMVTHIQIEVEAAVWTFNLGVRFNLLATYFDVHSLKVASEFQ